MLNVYVFLVWQVLRERYIIKITYTKNYNLFSLTTFRLNPYGTRKYGRKNKKIFLSQSSNSIFLLCVQKKKINEANTTYFSCETDFNNRAFCNVSSYRTLSWWRPYLDATKAYSRLILPYVILVDEYYDSPGVVLRAQPFDYSIEVFGPGIPQDLLADCDTDVVLRREGNEAGDALKIEFQPQINCLSVRREIEFWR